MKKLKLLMVDNYDSFTFNIVQYFGELGAEVEVFRNDEITLEGIAAQGTGEKIVARLALARLLRPAFRWRPFNTSQVSCPFWVCAWAIKALAQRLAAKLFVHKS